MRIGIAKIIVFQVHSLLIYLKIKASTYWVPLCAEKVLYSLKAFVCTDK